ncbi:phospholipid-transporting ATPase ABCA3-like isoform X2 [Vulpes vulpes]|uniref:Phospholipid-transporting ATPase ABCA3-like isoform X2 n=1 Tax=Vulpes vulpes TaxID=9627 RepID=A0ABM5A4T2_VULVU
MDLLTFNQFAVLLWKNFTLKRRQVFTLILEILTVLVFPVMILLFRKLTSINVVGPYNYTSQPINTLPPFLKNPEDWELIYVPSNIDVVSEITESMKRNLNISVKVRGFASEIEFERYIEYDYGSHKVLAAIIFDCNFKSSSDPLPLQEYQLIIGLQNWIIWAAYFFTFFFFYIIIISLICVLFSAKIFSEPIFRFSDSSFIFVFLMCYAIASIFFAFMVSTFFNKVHLAASAGSLLYFATFFPFNTIIKHYGHMTLTQKVTVCLSSNVALALGISRLLKLELKQIGVRWDNIWRPVYLEDNLIFGYILLMLLLDAFLYGLVTWYMETIFPGQCGVPQPWYFFLLRSYWLGETKIREKKEVKNCGQTPNKHFEAEPTSLVAGIQIKHLHKEFGDKVVVNNMSLNLFKGQITILLGQNGAGKTTILSLLTGRYPPTREEVYIHGFDISKNIMEIRKNLGFCPQQDLLFNDMTISEHLFFFSVVVLLDEPSSGMDPVSRRATWELLQQYKQNRTILLTTHYMDEADLLGDRIAIMVRGTLQCCGSSVFLKQTYGAGYHIVMEKESHCDVEKISEIIHSHIPDATVENFTGAELSFILPKEYTHRQNY